MLSISTLEVLFPDSHAKADSSAETRYIDALLNPRPDSSSSAQTVWSSCSSRCVSRLAFSSACSSCRISSRMVLSTNSRGYFMKSVVPKHTHCFVPTSSGRFFWASVSSASASLKRCCSSSFHECLQLPELLTLHLQLDEVSAVHGEFLTDCVH